MSTSATMTQEKRALAGMLSRSKSPSLRRSMPCTLPHMERATSADSQVCDLHSQMHVCSCTCTDCTVAFQVCQMAVPCHTLMYICLCVHNITTCLPAKLQKSVACLLFILLSISSVIVCNGLCSGTVVYSWAVVLVPYSTVILQASMRHPAWKTSAGE